MEIIADSFAEMYDQGRKALLSYGDVSSPRNMQTLELTGVTFVLRNPRSRLGYHPERHFSIPFAVAEAIMLFANTNDATALMRINKRMHQFSDDGVTTYGNYGFRIASSISTIVEKLKKDPDTRQAVLSIHAREDIIAVSKDIPCTLALQFMIRRNKLYMFSTMRSNDFFWGLPYDTFMFTVLQEVIANELGIDVGYYYHRANSLHVYTERHESLLTKIETMQAIEFDVQYDIQEMQFLTATVMNMKNVVPPLPYGDSFVAILRNFELKKRGMAQEALPSTAHWAEPFLEKK